MNKKFDLEDSLVDFAILALQVAEKLPKTYIGRHFGRQLIRSGSSPALNYGEAQAAESRNDFVHKMKICLKELRETMICLKIISRKPLVLQNDTDPVLKECNELISIFVKSIQTAQNREK